MTCACACIELSKSARPSSYQKVLKKAVTHTGLEQPLSASTQDNETERTSDPVERFFRTRVAPIVLDWRWRAVFAALFCCWLLPSAIFVGRLKPTTEQEQFLRSDHPLQKSISALSEFPVSSRDTGIDIFFTWGLLDIDRNGANMLFNLTYVGEPRFSSSFRFTPQCMDKVREVCDNLRTNVDYLNYLQVCSMRYRMCNRNMR